MTVDASGGARWEIVVGLEVHCELSTATKLFCSCPNAFGAEPNTNVCPVCLGLPGSLPVLNARAVEFAMRIGTALGSRVECRRSSTGRTTSTRTCRRTTRSASTTSRSTSAGRVELADGSLDRHRAGAPRGGHRQDDPRRRGRTDPRRRLFARRLQPRRRAARRDRLRPGHPQRRAGPQLRERAAGDPRRDRGLRRPDGGGFVADRRQRLGSPGGRRRVRDPLRGEEPQLVAIARACRSTTRRPARSAIIEAGGAVVQETRHWNEDEGRTSPLRSKEEAFDYRYFTEPDLVPLAPPAEEVAAVAAGLGPMPAARRRRLGDLVAADGSPAPVDQLATVVGLGLDDLVLAAVDARRRPAARPRPGGERGREPPDEARALDPVAFAELVKLEADGQAVGDPVEVGPRRDARGRGRARSRSRRASGSRPSARPSSRRRSTPCSPRTQTNGRAYRAGDAKVAQFLLGAVMRATRGRANGKAVAAALETRRN